MAGSVFIGTGGWTFEPWRGVFYPPGLAQKSELKFMSETTTSLDVATNDGRLIADILASLAAHERRRLRDRQRQGIAAARSTGRHLGRPAKMNGQQIGEARARLAADEPASIVARAYSVTSKILRATLARGGGPASTPLPVPIVVTLRLDQAACDV